jgi:hypothetical protein
MATSGKSREVMYGIEDQWTVRRSAVVLNYLAESTIVNVGGYPETEASRSAGETWVASEAS